MVATYVDLGIPEDSIDDAPYEVDDDQDVVEEEYVEDLDPESAEFYDRLIKGILVFCEEFSDVEFRPYQQALAYRIVESLVKVDTQDITALWARQCLDGDTVVYRRDGSAVRLRNHEDAWSTGVRKTKRYVIQGGGEVIATDNHPLLTPRGWVPAGALVKGDKVASLHEWSQWGTQVVSNELAQWMGYFVTDGSLRPNQSAKFTNTRTAYLEEVDALTRSLFGMVPKWYPKGNGYDLLFTTPKGQPNAVLTYLKKQLNWDHKFPLEVFQWPKEQVVEFINRAWSGDGSCCTKMSSRGFVKPEVFLACGNDEIYARYWQMLLLKLGVESTVKREHMTKGTGTFHRLVISQRTTARFFEEVGPIYGKEEMSKAAWVACTWASGTGVGKGAGKKSINTFTDGFEDEEHLASDGELLVWRPIVRIEDAGEQEVFDVTYAQKGWFTAQGVITSNSGKSETLAVVIAGCMVILPKLAQQFDILERFKNGLWVGMFAPVKDQSGIIHSRVVRKLTSDHALEMLQDPEIDDRVDGKTGVIQLKSGSLSRRQTANPRAQIEGDTYHLVVIDEAQNADDTVVRKSIHPMLAANAGAMVKIGTPSFHKGDFYRSIQMNKRRATNRGGKKNHFEYNWEVVAKYNPYYLLFLKEEKRRLGEDSEEFQMSYNLRWMLDRGMLITENDLDNLGDKSMQLVKSWHKSPCVVGIDPARVRDSTVVTVCWVDWDHPDSTGYREHRILNWLEIQNTDWETQYYQIVEFLDNYKIAYVGVDAQGMGGPVAERLRRMLEHRCEVVSVSSDSATQSERWKHLISLLQRQLIGYPAHSKARRTKVFERFYQQMENAEKLMKGQYMMVQAPEDERDSHDDYVDSLAIACAMSLEDNSSYVETFDNPFFSR